MDVCGVECVWQVKLLMSALAMRRGSLLLMKRRKTLLSTYTHLVTLDRAYTLSLSPNQIDQLCAELVDKLQVCTNQILTLKPDERTFENTFEALDATDGEVATISGLLSLPSMVSSDEQVKQSSSNARERLAKFWSERNCNIQLYELLTNVQDGDERLKSKMLASFEIAGSRAEVKNLQDQISKLATEFENNYNNDDEHVWFQNEELDGLEENFINTLQTDGNLVGVSLKRPEIQVALRGCKSASTRRRLGIAIGRKCISSNASIVNQIVALRNKAARMTGYRDHAELILRRKMAQNIESVKSLLHTVSEGMKQSLKDDLKELESYLENGETLTIADVPYCSNMRKKDKYDLDEVEVSKYFPLSRVVDQTMRIYEEVLGLSIVEEKDPEHVWHESVRKFNVTEADTGQNLGFFFMDLFPRPGKYPHQCVYPLRPCLEDKQQPPAVAILGNLTAPSEANPDPCLHFFEVVTFFHEFGHVLHALSVKTKYCIYSWSWNIVSWPGGVENDFLETPSQMFENWCYDPRVLKRLSGKPNKDGILEPLPDILCEKLVATRYVGAAYRYMRQISYSEFDLRIHSENAPEKTEVLWGQLAKKYGLLTPFPDTNPGASFLHPMRGYDVGYYSYLWSEVFSHDLFSVFESAELGCLNPNVGLKFRRMILEPGASRSGSEMLESFLGRKPNPKAFFEKIGIN